MSRKICFIGGGLKGGGQERALSGMANYYAKKKDTVSVINLFRTEQFFELDNRIQVFWPKINRQKYNKIIYALLIIPYLRKAVKDFNPDVLLSYGDWFNPFVILATRGLKKKVYVFDRMGPGINLGYLINNARKLTYRLADGVAVQTQIAADIVRQQTKAKNINVLPNPVNVIETKRREKKNQIVTLGRLSKEKGHLILIKAFDLLSDTRWTLHIIGDGPERSKLEKEAEQLGLLNRVIFHGHKKNFNEILGQSKIFVLPSFYEGYPNALLEAMSVPLACISSDCIAGPRDIIQNGVNGILVKPNDVKELAEAIENLISDETLRRKLADEAYKVRLTYNFDVIAKRYLEFILSDKIS